MRAAFFLKLVGARGFEPPTPTTPLWCATRLRYAPTGAMKLPSRLASTQGSILRAAGAGGKRDFLAAQYLKNLFKFHSYLLDYLLTLRHI